MDTLGDARAIVRDLKEGISGPGARSAARRLRRLLGASGLGLADLTGALLWSGRSRPEGVGELVERVLQTEAPAQASASSAVPLHAGDELAGVLVVVDAPGRGALDEAAAWVADALERGRLEASAERAAQAELRALRAEISPHFVYNALTVIASLVRSEPDRARELMLDFADYTRYSLARRGDYTTVSDEFHAIETYLALQRAVLGERLRVQVRVAPEVLGVAVPYLVVQPLVENAIRHGIEPRSGAGLVQVSGEAQGNDCVITVEDDGVGMDPGLARDLLSGRGRTDSVGLSNVDRRLRHVYGPWYGLVVETAVNAGTRVVVRVPLFQPGVMPS
ncbi:sensor histidine kinase [Marinactinospora thermotolerans]|uniref:Two-component system, LytT family, sensor kinase n=1 Tax=Marinactinospora thermotolerans DSM 45154 TaxID=1122192 RepID=A0A1T4K2D4_9ACTN|nr:histidine kinase [Marinactinospora thermotolerans]SJZ36548.1 two-component system, LytT family, sensor kinase [Marinactinospora thermotolerans DSM 45154]